MPEVLAADVVKLSYMLPRDSSLRPSSGSDSFLFSCGAYVLGGINGLFANSKLFPQTSLVLTRFAKQVLGPSFSFSSCVLVRDNQPSCTAMSITSGGVRSSAVHPSREESFGWKLRAVPSSQAAGQAAFIPSMSMSLLTLSFTTARSPGPVTLGWYWPHILSDAFTDCLPRIEMSSLPRGSLSTSVLR